MSFSYKIMAPSGRKSTGKKTKLTQEGSAVHVYRFEDDLKKHLSGSDEDIREDEAPVIDKHGKKRPVTPHAGVEDDVGQKVNHEYSQQFLHVFQQWDADIQKAEEQEEKLNVFRQQQKAFQQARIVQSQRLKTIKQLYEQFLKSMEDMEKTHESLLAGAQSELRKEMSLWQKKIMMDTQQQEMATVRKSLQSMLY
ncbi:hypothetical protein E2320_004164 [Naja naja]|nr:hypothetical protein E2320_004164 [Naja naja]